MSHLPIPLAVVYAGLAGTLLSLLVAAITNRWSVRVFFLLALRLAIGWHFMFEGFHKIHSHVVGPTETNRPFSSEPYFKVAPGPLGEKMRKEFSDPLGEIAVKVKAPKEISPADFAKLSLEEQAAACPEAVAKPFDTDAMLKATEEGIKLEAEADLKDAARAEEKGLKDADEAEQKALQNVRINSVPPDGFGIRASARRIVLQAQRTGADKAEVRADAEKARKKVRADAEKARQDAKKRAETFAELAPKRIAAAKAEYARWVYGVDGRNAQVKFVGEVMMTGPERISHLAWVRGKAKEAEERESNGLGNGTGTDVKRVAEYRAGVITAEADLARDANTFITDLKKALSGGKFVEEPAAPSRGQQLDKFTMWFLVAVGGCVMFGLFTRLACVLACGFLVMTYLSHPAFPWYPLPPGTEGNPVFVNKNVIEALALLVLACYPTGRWLGLDALVLRPFVKYTPERPVA